ncbi:acetolactate decarboxylase [Methanosphaera sp. BMS]|uniref:acetolactate decarboxylase n=1 Tax=Methanosphaera sp. BMS TaxID=1789762 RepID=UPI000DC1CEA6|nr:acetolactate decarboxylase [Methanosphaera sp. BMS]AWX31875.1 hypothetical protein AW729_01670 [Methanosphaera sp. BMS]
MLNKKLLLISIFIATLLTIAAVNADEKLLMPDDSMHQVSLMQSFMHGAYDGVLSVGELKSNGDTGLGTFEGVNGEMIVLDGNVYQARADGSVHVMPDNEKVPFATVTHFDNDANINNISAKNFDDLTGKLDNEIKKYGKNNMYVVKIKCNCSNITVRSVEKQEKPYKEFTEVAAVDQKVFNYTNQTGTLIAIYFPEYMNEINMPGWHIHFLNDAKDKGGHVLGLTIENGTGQMDEIHEFDMDLPTTDTFKNMDFSEDMSQKINSVE